VLTLTALAAAFVPASIRADVGGFGSLNPSLWKYNHCDPGTPPVIVNSETIQLTTGPDQCRSIWYNTPQQFAEFLVTFTYRASSISASAVRQGITFALQNSPAGLGAIGSGGSGFGYAGITQSAAITIETDTGPALTYTGFYTNGVLGGGSFVTTPVNAFNFRDINVTIAYDGSILAVSMAEGANIFPTHNYLVGSLASTLGSSTAYVGFTAGTANTLGSGGGASQFLSIFRYGPLPEPSTISLLAVIGAICLGRARRRA